MKTLNKAFMKSNFLNKARVRKTVFSLEKSKDFLKLFSFHLPLIVIFSSGLTGITPRLRHFYKFALLLVKTYNNHGALYTVKWLKACHTSIQKYISGEPFRSLRSIEPDLPLPRLINGLPHFIGSMDRKAIRNRHAPTIRMWLSVLSIYRVLDAPRKWKLETITNPYGGSEIYIDVISHGIFTSLREWRSSTPYFSHLAVRKLEAKHLRLSSKAGPNGGPSYTKVLVDALSVYRFYPVHKALLEYMDKTSSLQMKDLFLLTIRGSIYWNRSEKAEKVLNYPQVVEEYDMLGGPRPRQSPHYVRGNYMDLFPGALHGIPEPAGKMRVIALVDVWTQSMLKPLHDSLFDILRKLPNDGTFDQEASVRRSTEKALLARQAYSVDLSAATDRLPIRIQENILNFLFGNGIGSTWRKLLNRPFVLRERGAGYGNQCLGEVFEYGCGQPMGCLSSWAMLAITHHMIVQQCAREILGTTQWHTCYEILGDDLVIFDKQVYLEYLRVMALLDVGTNPSKSLISESSATFEFAKRTVMDGVDVSGLSWQQFVSTTGVKLRLNLILSLGLKGLIWRDGLLIRLLTHTPFIKRKALSSDGAQGLMISLFSYFANKGVISYKDAIAYVVNPSKGEAFYENLIDLPVKQSVHDLVTLFGYVFNPVQIFESVQDLLTLSRFRVREQLGASRIVPPLGRSIYEQVLDSVDRYNDNVHKVRMLLIGFLIPDYPNMVANTPWDERTEDQYKLDNMLSRLAASLLDDESSSDATQDVIDFNESTDVLPPLEAILKFSDLMTGVISKYSFLSQSKPGRELNVGPTSWLQSDIQRASSRIRAPQVLDNILPDDTSSHDPFVGVWDVMIPDSKGKASPPSSPNRRNKGLVKSRSNGTIVRKPITKHRRASAERSNKTRRSGSI